jgi:hypothetical protein
MSDPNRPGPDEVTSLNADELDLEDLEEASGGQCEVYTCETHLPPTCSVYYGDSEDREQQV